MVAYLSHVGPEHLLGVGGLEHVLESELEAGLGGLASAEHQVAGNLPQRHIHLGVTALAALTKAKVQLLLHLST